MDAFQFSMKVMNPDYQYTCLVYKHPGHAEFALTRPGAHARGPRHGIGLLVNPALDALGL